MSLEQSEKDGQVGHLRSNTDHIGKNLVKIGPVNPKCSKDIF